MAKLWQDQMVEEGAFDDEQQNADDEPMESAAKKAKTVLICELCGRKPEERVLLMKA